MTSQAQAVAREEAEIAALRDAQDKAKQSQAAAFREAHRPVSEPATATPGPSRPDGYAAEAARAFVPPVVGSLTVQYVREAAAYTRKVVDYVATRYAGTVAYVIVVALVFAAAQFDLLTPAGVAVAWFALAALAVVELGIHVAFELRVKAVCRA